MLLLKLLLLGLEQLLPLLLELDRVEVSWLVHGHWLRWHLVSETLCGGSRQSLSMHDLRWQLCLLSWLLLRLLHCLSLLELKLLKLLLLLLQLVEL
jgi:hypothetical protein